MKKNVGNGDRIARVVAAVGLGVCAVVAPLPLWIRVAGFALNAAYLAFTALSGTCLGYRLLGRSTCPAESR
jgi:hypothetical protein